MKLQRVEQATDGTFGEWFDDDGELLFVTCEPADPMPAGVYDVVLRYSPSHGYAVPGFREVPGHSDIEVHPGNTIADTRDCVLPGSARADRVRGSDGVVQRGVVNSRVTFANFMQRLGVPDYRTLRDWDSVKTFLDQRPAAGRFRVEVVDVAQG